MKLDVGRAWTDAMAMLKGGRDVLLTVAGFFILLPAMFLNAFAPFQSRNQGLARAQDLIAWTQENFVWILIGSVLAALGRLAILILLLGPGRPTVKDALAAGVRLLALFVLVQIISGFMLMGGAFLFVLPALYLFGRLFLAETALVAERLRSPVAAVTRSFQVTRGNGWRLFAVGAIVYIAGAILTAAIGSVLGVFAALSGDRTLDLFVTAFVDALFGAGVSLILTLMAVAFWRQSADQGHVRSSVAR